LLIYVDQFRPSFPGEKTMLDYHVHADCGNPSSRQTSSAKSLARLQLHARSCRMPEAASPNILTRPELSSSVLLLARGHSSSNLEVERRHCETRVAGEWALQEKIEPEPQTRNEPALFQARAAPAELANEP
jgi:hypothetical protein